MSPRLPDPAHRPYDALPLPPGSDLPSHPWASHACTSPTTHHEPAQAAPATTPRRLPSPCRSIPRRSRPAHTDMPRHVSSAQRGPSRPCPYRPPPPTLSFPGPLTPARVDLPSPVRTEPPQSSSPRRPTPGLSRSTRRRPSPSSLAWSRQVLANPVPTALPKFSSTRPTHVRLPDPARPPAFASRTRPGRPDLPPPLHARPHQPSSDCPERTTP